ncbi:MAG: hypothetical protein ACE5JH_06355 [Acidobacteriota bacterium]
MSKMPRALGILALLGALTLLGSAGTARGEPGRGAAAEPEREPGAEPETRPEGEHRPMSAARLQRIIRGSSTEFRRAANVMEFRFDGVQMACVYDTAHDRMRLVAPITKMSRVTLEQTVIVLEANYHTALDGRYASSNGTLYAAYIHPLSDLHPGELRSGLRQVASLVKTFGTTFTSGELVFGAPSGEEEEDEGPRS